MLDLLLSDVNDIAGLSRRTLKNSCYSNERYNHGPDKDSLFPCKFEIDHFIVHTTRKLTRTSKYLICINFRGKVINLLASIWYPFHCNYKICKTDES